MSSFISISIRRSASSNSETFFVPTDATVASVMETLDANIDKNIIIRDSEELDGSETLNNGDELVIMPRKLSSGC